MDEDDEAAILLAGLGGGRVKDYDDAIFRDIEKGEDYQWDRKPQVGRTKRNAESKPN